MCLNTHYTTTHVYSYLNLCFKVDSSSSLGTYIYDGNAHSFSFYVNKLNENEHLLYLKHISHDNYKFPVPFGVQKDIHSSRRAENVFKCLIESFSPNSGGMRRFEVNGNEYYSGNGLLLGKNFIPLIICVHRIIDNTNTDVVFFVSPDAFLSNDRIVEKYIVRNYIPAILSFKSVVYDNITYNFKVEIKDDINKFIKRNVAPENVLDTQYIQDYVIKDNVNEYISYIDHIVHGNL